MVHESFLGGQMAEDRAKIQGTLVNGDKTYVTTMEHYPKETDPFKRYCPLTLTVNGQSMSVANAEIIDMIIDAPDTRWEIL
jgi:hypothetical protein